MDTGLGSSGLRRKVEGLLDCESGEVYVVFGAILDITTVVRGNLSGCKGVIVPVTGDRVEFLRLVGESFEESAAA